MTRYARAQGSKSCNSKQVQVSTSWKILKNKSMGVTDDSQSDSVKGVVRPNGSRFSEVVGVDGSWFDFCGNTQATACRKNLKSSANKKDGEHEKLRVKSNKSYRIQRTVEDETGLREGRVPNVISRNTVSNKPIENDRPSSQVLKRHSGTSSDKIRKVSVYSKGPPEVGSNKSERGNSRIKDRGQLRELRRKEKALKREKKKVCFCCRRWGHQLSDCPEFHPENNMEMTVPAGGFCYRCGSTEHTMNQCSKAGNSVLKFARCFVCGEEGHLARECSDNPNGTYPKGGACLTCGDTNHLRIDCPKDNKNNDEAVSALAYMISGPVDSLPEDLLKDSSKHSSSRKEIQF